MPPLLTATAPTNDLPIAFKIEPKIEEHRNHGVAITAIPTPPLSRANIETVACPTPPLTITNQALSINESSCSSDTSTSSTTDSQKTGSVKLERVGEAVPAYNLCAELKYEKIQCAKIERLVNDLHSKMNGDSQLCNGLNELVKHHNGNGNMLEKLVNGHGHEDHHHGLVNGFSKSEKLHNGEIQSKSDIVEKINDDLNAKLKRKLQNEPQINANEDKSPKKKSKKINEMNLAPMSSPSVLSAALTKPPQVSILADTTPSLTVQQQPHVSNSVNGVAPQPTQQNQAFLVNSVPVHVHMTQSPLQHTRFDFMCEWNNCNM
jgi:hypothetical protein